MQIVRRKFEISEKKKKKINLSFAEFAQHVGKFNSAGHRLNINLYTYMIYIFLSVYFSD